MLAKNLSDIIKKLQGQEQYMYCKSSDYYNKTDANISHIKCDTRSIEILKQPLKIPNYYSIMNAPHIQDGKRFLDNQVTIFKVSNNTKTIVIDISDYIPPNYNIREFTKGYNKIHQFSFGPISLDHSTIDKRISKFNNYTVDKIQVLSLLKITNEHTYNSLPIKMWDYTVYVNECIPHKSWYTFTKDGMTEEKASKMINLVHYPCYLRGDSINGHISIYKTKRITYDS